MRFCSNLGNSTVYVIGRLLKHHQFTQRTTFKTFVTLKYQQGCIFASLSLKKKFHIPQKLSRTNGKIAWQISVILYNWVALTGSTVIFTILLKIRDYCGLTSRSFSCFQTDTATGRFSSLLASYVKTRMKFFNYRISKLLINFNPLHVLRFKVAARRGIYISSSSICHWFHNKCLRYIVLPQ